MRIELCIVCVLALCASIFCDDSWAPRGKEAGNRSVADESDGDSQECARLEEVNERLRLEIQLLRGKIEAMQEDDEDEDSNESHSRSRGLRTRRSAVCDAGTLAAWACAPQCVFKLKGLCGLSLKSICHC